MTELVNRFIRTFPQHKYKIVKKHEKDYSLTFWKDNKIREIIINDDMTWNVIMKKYNDIDNSECSICYNNKTFMFKCKYCAFVLCVQCLKQLRSYKCAYCRREITKENLEHVINCSKTLEYDEIRKMLLQEFFGVDES